MSHQSVPPKRANDQNLLISDVMTSPVTSIAPNSLIEEALEIMLDKSISGLPVLNPDGTPAGIISEYDVFILLSDTSGTNGPIAPVAHFMTTDVYTVDINQPLDDVIRLFSTIGIRRLPVVDQGRVVGIVCRRDLVRVIRDRRRAETIAWNGGELAAGDAWVQMPEVKS
jgi:CBS domain-containing protein